MWSEQQITISFAHVITLSWPDFWFFTFHTIWDRSWRLEGELRPFGIVVIAECVWGWGWYSGGMVLTGENWITGQWWNGTDRGKLNNWAVVEWYWQGKTEERHVGSGGMVLTGENWRRTVSSGGMVLTRENWITGQRWNGTDRGKLNNWAVVEWYWQGKTE